MDPISIDIIGQAHEARMPYASSLLMLSRRAEAAAALRPVFDEIAVSGEIGGALLAGRRIIAQLASASWHNELAPQELAQLEKLGVSSRGQAAQWYRTQS